MKLSDLERRRRLVERHRLGRTARDGLEAVRAVAAFHSTDPVTPHLGMWVRVPGFDTVHLDHLLLEARSLWRMHAMRRTLFLVPTDEGSIFLTGASLAVARRERARLEGWLGAVMPTEMVRPWLQSVSAQVMEVMEGGGELRTPDLTAAVPDLDRKIKVGTGRFTADTPVSSRLLYLLGMEGRIVRTRPAGSWRSSQYRWAAASWWWKDPPTPALDEAEGRVEVTRRYLATHGPVTLTDLRWWTGWTAGHARAALGELGPVPVRLEGGGEGYVLADDTDPVDEPASPSVAFLPGLDPTPMGWKERGWYLGPHGEALFDRNGNVGPTVWLDGRIVGGWGQRQDGRVAYALLDDVDAAGVARIEEEAAALSAWLNGQVVSLRFKTPLERKLAEGSG